MSLPVSVILERKGRDVVTIEPDAMLLAAADKLAEHNIGALVVCQGDRVAGIVSERDIVRHLARYRTAVVKRTVGEIMSADVRTCRPESTIDDVMGLMTQRRIRHIPVCDDDESIVGIVSIGDVVKFRLDELEVTNQSLEQYVAGAS